MAHLYGPPNPKTLIPPIIPPPLADFMTWRDNSRTPNTYINASNQIFYSGQSGYDTVNIPRPCTNETETIINLNSNVFDTPLSGPYSWARTIPASVNSNMGISSQPQTGFQTNFGSSGGDYQLFVEDVQPPEIPQPNLSLELGREIREMIPDPRTYGYGPSNRIVIDNRTGMPFYDYSDIDNERRQNYISRFNTNLDLTDRSTWDVKYHAQEKFIDDSNIHRIDLQNSLLRKRNSELWQLKVAPISPLKF